MPYDDEDTAREQRAVALRPKQVMEADIEPLSAAEIVLLQGDLSILSAAQRVEYYAKVCESVGLNPLTKPFDYIVLNGKLTLYAKKDATDQLRSIHGISITKLEREQTPDSYEVTAYGTDRTGRQDASLGSVPITNLRGEALANAKMKAETKAKRRLTLSLAGMGWLDETEVGSVASAVPVIVDDEGEISEPPPKAGLAEVVAERLSLTRGAAEDAEEHQDTAPDAPGQGKANGEASGAQEEATGTGDAVAAAKAIFDGDLTEMSFADFKARAREKHVLMGQVRGVALKTFDGIPDVPPTVMVEEMSDSDRHTLWLAIEEDLARAASETA